MSIHHFHLANFGTSSRFQKFLLAFQIILGLAHAINEAYIRLLGFDGSSLIACTVLIITGLVLHLGQKFRCGKTWVQQQFREIDLLWQIIPTTLFLGFVYLAYVKFPNSCWRSGGQATSVVSKYMNTNAVFHIVGAAAFYIYGVKSVQWPYDEVGLREVEQ